MSAKFKCIVEGQKKTISIQIEATATLASALRKFKIPIGYSCGGEGICTTCRVEVLKGQVSLPTLIEQERITERGFNKNERLSCQAKALSDLKVKVPSF